MSLPKLSYVLLTHNRKPYIKRAVQCALSQDYDGELEFIFSDDCSSDGSYELLQECVNAYQGPRHITLTQTPRPMHLAGHTNHALQFVTGDWILRADDDDFSKIDRCSIIGKALEKYPDCRYLIHPHYSFTDAEEERSFLHSQCPLPKKDYQIKLLDTRHGSPFIAGHLPLLYSYKVWHRDVYRHFGELSADAYYVDDLCCYYRANILGYGICLPDAPLLYQRIGCNNMCRGGDDLTRGYRAIIRLEHFNDQYYNITIPPLYEELLHYKQCSQSAQELLTELEQELSKRQELASFWRKGCFNRFKLTHKYKKMNIFGLIRCLPLPLFALLLSLYRKAHD